MTAALVATVCLSGAAPARAGQFPVAACNDATSATAHAWTQARTISAEQVDFATVCPSGTPDPYGDLRNGLAVIDRVKVYGAQPDGAYAEWRFQAPAGTTIRAASITRDIGNRDEWTPYGRIDGVDQAGETCMRGMNQSFCRIQGTRVFGGLSATTVAYGIRCVVAPYCAHGATLRSVWVLILGATVTLDDREGPAVSNVESVGLADGAWWNRVGSVAFSATDNTGVRRRRVVVNGVERVVVDAPGSAAGGCGELGRGVAYSYSRPCADGRGLNGAWSVSVDPCRWGDGAHSVRGAAVDTGGLEAMSPTAATVRVDCSAPVVSASQAREQLREGEPVEPVVAASDAASGLTRTDVEVSVDGGGWAAHGAPLLAEAGRAYAFRARALDRAGNWSAWATTHSVTASAPPPAPEPGTETGGTDTGGTETHPEEERPAGPGEARVAREQGVVGGGGEGFGPLPPVSPVALVEDGPVATPRADPRLRITSVRARRRGAVTVAGTIARAATGRVTVVLRARNQRAKRRSAPIRAGRWRTTFRLRAGARPTRITASTAASEGFEKASAAARLAHHPAE